MFSFRTIQIGTGGVAPCATCPHPEVKAASSDEVMSIIAALPEDTNAVVLRGFEPFSHPALPLIISALRERGVSRILLQTDGGALPFGGNAEGVIDASVRLFEFIYRAGESSVHDTLCGKPGLAAARRSGIERLHMLQDTHPELHLTLIGVADLCRHNSDELLSIAQAALREGLDGLRITTSANAKLKPEAVQAAAELLIPAGVFLFGEGCGNILGGISPYTFVEAGL